MAHTECALAKIMEKVLKERFKLVEVYLLVASMQLPGLDVWS